MATNVDHNGSSSVIHVLDNVTRDLFLSSFNSSCKQSCFCVINFLYKSL